MSIALSPLLPRPAAAVRRTAQPLDVIFFAITLIIPIETIMQAAFGASMAFGRFIAPAFIVAYLVLRPPQAAFRLPPGFLLTVPYFLVFLGHIASQGEWFSVYNYRSYVLNAVLCIAAYNYALSNRPSPCHVLFATYAGIALIALWTVGSGQMAEVGRGRFSLFDMDENGLGSTYGLAVVITAVLSSRPDVRLPVKVLMLAGALPCAALMLATGSRGALASTLLGVFAQAVYLAVFRRRRGFLLGLLALGAIVGAGKQIYDQTDVMKRRVERTITKSASNQDRFGHRDLLVFGAAELIAESPLVGWGEKAGWDELALRAFGGGRDYAGTHNTFMLVLVTSGMFAGGAFLWWMLHPMFPRARLLSNLDYGNLYVVVIFIYGTFLTLDRLGHRQWWWLFPLFLAQTGFAGAATQKVVAARPVPHVDMR